MVAELAVKQAEVIRKRRFELQAKCCDDGTISEHNCGGWARNAQAKTKRTHTPMIANIKSRQDVR